jgi:hypothetical protein
MEAVIIRNVLEGHPETKTLTLGGWRVRGLKNYAPCHEGVLCLVNNQGLRVVPKCQAGIDYLCIVLSELIFDDKAWDDDYSDLATREYALGKYAKKLEEKKKLFLYDPPKMIQACLDEAQRLAKAKNKSIAN